MSNLITKLNYSKLKQIKYLILNTNLRNFASVGDKISNENEMETHFGFETVKTSEKAQKGNLINLFFFLQNFKTFFF